MHDDTVEKLIHKDAMHQLEWDLKNKFDFSDILSDALMKRIRLFLEDNNSDDLGVGQIPYWGVHINDPPGKPLDEMKKCRVLLTFYHPDDHKLLREQGIKSLRQSKIMRMTIEARDDIYNPQLDRNLISVLCNRFRERYRFLGGEEITQFIVEDILEVVEEYRRPLSEVKKGQIVWDGAEVDQGRKPGYGLSMKNTKVKPVVLTLVSEEDIRMLKEGATCRAVKKVAIERIFNEAMEQGVVLNHVDASLILKCDRQTVSSCVKDVEAEKNVQMPDRGKVHDMGRSVTHKKEIVRYMLQNYSQIEIKRLTHHSGEAIR